jgi:hypothetical protein
MYGHFAARRAPLPAGTGVAGLCLALLAFGLPLGLAGTAAAQEGVAPSIRYGRVAVDQAPLYCWPSEVASPPHYEDTLAKGDAVQLGRSESTFVQVVLPLGPVGYVSKRFAAAGEDGKVRTKGTKVSFRFRMVTTEAPVLQLDDGVELCVVGEQGEWWRVRLPAAEAWLPAAQVTTGAAGDAALAAEWEAVRARHQGEVDARLAAIATEKQRLAQAQADAAAVGTVDDALRAEMNKPLTEQSYQPLNATLDKVDAGLAVDSPAKALVASLRKRIQTQQWLVEAALVQQEKPVPAQNPLPAPAPKDSLERFAAIGWLRYEGRLGGLGTYYLEKGGLRLHHVSCSTGRYDLSMFVDCEVGVMGPCRRPGSESFSMLDIERLEVLGHNRR